MSTCSLFSLATSVLLINLLQPVSTANVISASSFSDCAPGQTAVVKVSSFNFQFSKDTKNISFNIAGTSTTKEDVTIQLNVTAYGIDALTKTINPCDDEYHITQLCPLNAGPFTATGNVAIPQKILNQIPAMAFKVPDLNGIVKMKLVTSDGSSAMCLEAPVGNGESLNSVLSQTITGTVAAGAILISGAASMMASLSSAGSASTVNPGGAAHSPNMGDIFMWFQSVALSGAMSVNYPGIYRSFTQNFGWTTGIISWTSMQRQIDTLRSHTGGNLTASSMETLQKETLIFGSENDQSSQSALTKRDLVRRQANSTESQSSTTTKVVGGLKAFAEQLRVPNRNTFVTMLVILVILLTSIMVIAFLVQLVLEVWARLGRFPKKLVNLRRNYWKTITGLIIKTLLVIYGTWSLFCFYQFRNGDSWAATLMAALSLGLFSGVILFFTIQISRIAWSSRHGGVNGVAELYEHTPHLEKYGTFYDQFKSKFWWFFIPLTLYSFAKAFFVGFGDGHGLFQVIGCLACELILLIFLFSTHAYQDRRANVVASSIGVVRLLSLIATLVFVDVFGFKQTTKTITGLVMIVIQSLLTALLVGLILYNAISPFFCKSKTNAHDAKHEEELTPLEPDAREKPMLDQHTAYDPVRDSVISDASDTLETKTQFNRDSQAYQAPTKKVSFTDVHDIRDHGRSRQ